MSSYPQHEENLKNLSRLGFDVEEYLVDTYESWGYDEQTCMVSNIIPELETLVAQNLALKSALETLIGRTQKVGGFPCGYLDDAYKALELSE